MTKEVRSRTSSRDDASGDDREDAVAAPAPPPPPPPPPPQDQPGAALLTASPPRPASAASEPEKRQRVDYRELFALFHADAADPASASETWESMWQLALVEAREEFRLQQLERKKLKKKGGADADTAAATNTPTRGATASSRHGAGNSGVPSADKRPRQMTAADVEANKASRFNRLQNRPKASKLLQKLGSRGPL